MENITQRCDDTYDTGDLLSKDIGTLFGQDIVATDFASYEMIKAKNGRDVFKKKT